MGESVPNSDIGKPFAGNSYGSPAAFRTDIQGLRAIAIVTVVVFHASNNILPGGFVGVDIFFVISGYLITGIIEREISAGEFSITGFYRRRIRRIFPALFVMFLAATLAGAALLSPTEYKEFADTLGSAIVFLSNMEFFRLSGYFDGSAELKPLLHTWSLSVEEQFYLVYPPILWLIHRQGIGLSPVIVAICVLSLGVSEWMVLQGRFSAAFYFFPPRAVELGIGALCATVGERFDPGPRYRDVLSCSGLVLMALSALFLSKSIPFPGVVVLLPCGGAALVILAGRRGRSLGGELISSPVFLFFGSISYSLYLWHWPVFVFARHLLGDDLTLPVLALALPLSVLLGWGSLRFIESPILGRRAAALPFLRLGGGAIAVGLVLSAGIHITQGLPFRFAPDQIALFSAAEDYNHRRDKCHNGGELIPYRKNCVFGDVSVAPDTAVWADSHGAELVVALGRLYGQEHRSLMQITASACPPAQNFQLPERPLCSAHNAEALRELLQDAHIKTVVLSANWQRYMSSDIAGALRGFLESAERLAQAGKRVVIVFPVPVFAVDPPAVLGVGAKYHKDLSRYGMPLWKWKEMNGIVYSAFAQAELRGRYEFLHVEPLLCQDSFCAMYREELGVLYFNSEHLSVTGAALIADKLHSSRD